MIKPKTGDVVHIKPSLVYGKYGSNEYDAVVLWNGFNRQPLITKVGEYKPHWHTYEAIERIIGHIDLVEALKAQEPVKPIPGLWDRDIQHYNCGACGGDIGPAGISKYCFYCGRPVKWEGEKV